MIQFTVPGRLKGKGRGRATVRHGHAVIYTPEQTRNCEAMVRGFASDAMRGNSILEGPLWLHVRILIYPPLSWGKKKKAEATYVTGKPDLDNVLKLIGDSLNGIVWRDDSQLAQVQIERHYISEGEERTEILVGDFAEGLTRDPRNVLEQFLALQPDEVAA